MSALGPLFTNAMSIVANQLGTPVKLFRGAVNNFGPDTQVNYTTPGGDLILGTWGSVEESGEIEADGSGLHGGGFIGTKMVRRSFTFTADQIDYRPSIDDHLVQPNNKNWQVLRAVPIEGAGTLIQWALTIEEIWPLPE